MDSAYESAEGLDVEVEGPVLRLVINRPKRRNTLIDTSMAALIRALERAATDEALRAVLLTAAGENFCGGFDLVARNAGTVGNSATTANAGSTGSTGSTNYDLHGSPRATRPQARIRQRSC